MNVIFPVAANAAPLPFAFLSSVGQVLQLANALPPLLCTAMMSVFGGADVPVRKADILPEEIVREPSAGTGLLAIPDWSANARFSLKHITQIHRRLPTLLLTETPVRVVWPEQVRKVALNGSLIIGLAVKMVVRRACVINDGGADLNGFTQMQHRRLLDLVSRL